MKPPLVRFLQSALVLAAFGPILVEWFHLTSNVSRIDYCLLVPFLALILAKVAGNATAEVAPPSASASRWGYICLGSAGLLLTLGSMAAILTVSIAGFPLAVVGLVGIHRGNAGIFRLRYALLMLFAMVPVPLPLLDWLTPSMVSASGATAAALVSPFDPEATWIGADLTYRGWTLFVAEACSGSGTLLVLATLTLFMAGLFRMKALSIVATLLIAAPLTLLINGVRIAAIALILDSFGTGVVTGIGHEIIGQVVVIGGAVGLTLGVDRVGVLAARWKEKREKSHG